MHDPDGAKRGAFFFQESCVAHIRGLSLVVLARAISFRESEKQTGSPTWGQAGSVVPKPTGTNPAIHPTERWLLSVLIFHLCLLPWALGTMRQSSQVVSLMLAVIGFGVALWPRSYALMPSEGGPCRIALWPRLLRFPVFWLGLLLLLYILLQITNPSWRYVQNTDFWWLVRVKDRSSWLPTSIQAPFSRFNPWRQLIIYASIWLLVCSVWVGLTRRKSLRMLLTAIVCNALALGVLLAIQRVTDNHRIPWPLTDWTDLGLTATFISYNHTGAFFALTVFCAFALASWHLDFGERSLLNPRRQAPLHLPVYCSSARSFFPFREGPVCP